MTKPESGSTDSSIQRGINVAGDGDTVNVEAGEYVENLTIPKPLHLLGAGEGQTIVYPAVSDVGADPDAGPAFRGSQMIVVRASDVEIAGMTLDGNNPDPLITSGVTRGGVDIDARNGIIEDYNAGVYNRLNVHDVTVQNVYLRGIYAGSGGSGFNISDNTVRNVQGGGSSIAIFNFGGSGTIADNVVSYASDGIAANHSRGTTFSRNILDHVDSGVHTDNSGDAGGPGDIIENNRVTGELHAGYGYGVWSFVPYTNVIVRDNVITDMTIGLGAFGGGGAKTTFSGNTVTLTAPRAGSVGAYVSTTSWYWGEMNVSAEFTGTNTISNADYGIYIERNPNAPTDLNPNPTAAVSLSGIDLDNNNTGIEIHGGDDHIRRRQQRHGRRDRLANR